MKEFTCIVVGAGHAGIAAMKSLQKRLRDDARGGRKFRFILIDKQPHHVRKVMLFKSAATESNIQIPLKQIFPSGVEIVQGAVSAIAREDRKVLYTDPDGKKHALGYDILILAVGSVVRQPEPEQGGIALTGVDAAIRIRDAWRANLRQALQESREEERRRLLSIAVAGAGISGIETSGELAYTMRKEAQEQGLDPTAVTVYLLNAHDRLFSNGSAKVSRKLDQGLAEVGVKLLHGVKALRATEGEVVLSSGASLAAGLCVWTLGLRPNPVVQRLGLPLTPEGQVVVDESYRVATVPGVYSIGDCARIVDPADGRPDSMTCKEAGMQAIRLAKIVAADLKGKRAPVHKKFLRNLYGFTFGPGQGVLWIRQWGLELMFAGRLGWKAKVVGWNGASQIFSLGEDWVVT